MPRALRRGLLAAAVTAVLTVPGPAKAAGPAPPGFYVLDARTGATSARLSETRGSARPVGSVLVDDLDNRTVLRDTKGRALAEFAGHAEVVAGDRTDVVVQDRDAEQRLRLISISGADRWAQPSPYGHVWAAGLDDRAVVVAAFRLDATGQEGECPELAAISRTTGMPAWSTPLRSDTLRAAYALVAPGEFPAPGGLCADPRSLVVGTRTITLVGTNLWTFDRNTGQLLYAVAPALENPPAPGIPARPLQGALQASGDIVVVSSPTEVRGVDPVARRTLWVRGVDQYAGPVVGAGIVVVQDRTRVLVLDLRTGAVRWTSTLRADIALGPGVVVRSSINRVSAYDATTGRLRWSAVFPGASTRVLVVGSTDTAVVVKVFEQRIVRD